MKKLSFICIFQVVILILSVVSVNAGNVVFTYGDVNRDQLVNICDVTYIQKFCANMVEFNEDEIFPADYNGDGKVDIRDCTAIQNSLVELPVNLIRNTYPAVKGGTRISNGEDIEFTVVKNFNVYPESSHSYINSNYGDLNDFTTIINTFSEYDNLFNDTYSEFDEKFFKNYSLIFLYRVYSCSEHTFSVDKISVNSDVLYLDDSIIFSDNEMLPDDFGYWHIFVKVKKSDIENVRKIHNS